MFLSCLTGPALISSLLTTLVMFPHDAALSVQVRSHRHDPASETAATALGCYPSRTSPPWGLGKPGASSVRLPIGRNYRYRDHLQCRSRIRRPTHDFKMKGPVAI